MSVVDRKRSNKFDSLLKIGILLIGVSTISVFWISLPIYNTFFWWSINIILLYAFIRCKPREYHPLPLVLWLAIIIIYSFWGGFLCRDYWDWKYLVSNIIAYSMCVASLTFSDPKRLSTVLRFWYKHAWKIIALLSPFFTYGAALSKSLIPYSFLALFFPLLGKKMKIFVLLSFFLTIVFAYMSRSDVLRFSVCIFCGFVVSCRKMSNNMMLLIKNLRLILLALPFCLFFLAYSGIFNIFNVQKEFDIQDTLDESGEGLFQDTRTILYEEVLASSIKHNTLWHGGTIARGYESAWVIRNQDNSDVLGAIHYGWRGNTEASVLNVLMHFGMIGLLLYFVVFYMATYYAIYRSKNDYMKILGLYVAFRWCLGCVEDSTNFDINMFMLWAMIGMCYSPLFRVMSNSEFKMWIKNTTRL